MQRTFLNQKLGKRNSRRAALQREKNRVAKVAGGPRPRRPQPESNIPGAR
jgi:hypothetical protein